MVGHYRMSDGCEVNANLMRPPGLWAHFDICRSRLCCSLLPPFGDRQNTRIELLLNFRIKILYQTPVRDGCTLVAFVARACVPATLRFGASHNFRDYLPLF